MKSVLNLIVSYLLVLVLGCLIGSIVVAEFLTTMQFVIGEKEAFFSQEVWLRSLVLVIPIVILVCPMLLSFYAARHHTQRLRMAISYAVLCCLTWLVLFPCYLSFLNKFQKDLIAKELGSSESAARATIDMSDGYFRKVGSSLYYNVPKSSGSGPEKIDAAAIYTDSVSFEGLFSSVSGIDVVLSEAAEPFSDVLVKEALSFRFLPLLLEGCRSILRNSLAAWNSGLIAWLFFAMFGLALSGVYIFIDLSSWKIVNSILIAFGSWLLIFTNCFYYHSLYQKFSGLALPSVFSSIDNAPLVLFNLFVGIVFLFVGVVTAIVRAAGAGD